MRLTEIHYKINETSCLKLLQSRSKQEIRIFSPLTLLQSKTNQFVLQAFSCWTSSTFSVLKTVSYKSIFTIRCLAIWLRMISYILFLRRLVQVLPCLAFLFYFSHAVYHIFEYFVRDSFRFFGGSTVFQQQFWTTRFWLVKSRIETVCSCLSRTRFRVNPHCIVTWMSRNSLLEAGAKSEV